MYMYVHKTGKKKWRTRGTIRMYAYASVSYTHLTLPTNREV